MPAGAHQSRGKPGEWVLTIQDLPLRMTATSWKPIKDLLRYVITNFPEKVKTPDMGSVNVNDSSAGHLLPWATCSLKSEKAANKAFNSLAGNYWYGSCLVVSLHDPNNSLVAIRNKSLFPQPLNLEKHSPITDASHLRSQIVPQSTSPATINGPRLPVPQSPQSSTNTGFVHHSHHSSTSSDRMPVSLSRHRSPSIPNPFDQSTSYTLVAQPSSMVAFNGQYAGMTFQQMSDQAYQIVRLHQPAQDQRVWTYQNPPFSSSWTSPIAAPTSDFAALQIAPMPAYAMTYAQPTPFATPITHYAYHTNPNGTVVNTSRGAVPVSESRAVLVRNLHYGATTQDFKAHFTTVGTVDHCDINVNSRDRRKCTALLTFSSAEEARAAVNQFDGTRFLDREIRAEVAKEDNSVATSRRTTSDASSTRSGQGPIIANGSDEDLNENASVTSSRSSRRGLRGGDRG